ncbi:MAG TPA: RNA polymerase sigma factor [Acidobacteriaceae bacterium]|nr:RNA polymerase sigma factor [Acidobacteriaceae bacterium]
MAFRNSAPLPDDPHDPLDGPLERPPDDDEGVLGPVPDVTEGWDEGEEAERAEVEGEDEAEISAQPDDPNGVSRDMASVALTTPGLGSRTAESSRGLKAPATAAEWRSMTDAEIMLRVREGDDVGFNFLIEKYRKPIMNFMYRMVHNQAVAEELAQEVFLRVYRSRQTYRAEAKFTTWLYRIATNLGVNHARDTKHERAAQTIYLDQPDPETGTTPDVADMHPGAEEEMVKDERMKAIRKHVMALPERQRTAVLMHKYQGMDYKEIGAVLRLSESATKSLLFRAYQTLRERLKEFVEQG